MLPAIMKCGPVALLLLIGFSEAFVVRDVDSIRVVAIGDTHNREYLPGEIPNGDVLIHVGDFIAQSVGLNPSEKLAIQEIEQQLAAVEHLRQLPHSVKIVVPGNHDRMLEEAFHDEWKHPKPPKHGLSGKERNLIPSDSWREKIKDAYKTSEDDGWVFLLHETKKVTVQGKELKVFGSPLSHYRRTDAFTFDQEDDEDSIWEEITDEKPDIVITHGPPFDDMAVLKSGQAVLDRDMTDNKVAGSKPLRKAVEKAGVPLVLFGHIHGIYPEQQHEYAFDQGALESLVGAEPKHGLMANVAAVYSFYLYEVFSQEECEYWTPKSPLIFYYNHEDRVAQAVKSPSIIDFPAYPPWGGPLLKPAITGTSTKGWKDDDWVKAAVKLKADQRDKLLPESNPEAKKANPAVVRLRDQVKEDRSKRSQALGKAYGEKWTVTYPE